MAYRTGNRKELATPTKKPVNPRLSSGRATTTAPLSKAASTAKKSGAGAKKSVQDELVSNLRKTADRGAAKTRPRSPASSKADKYEEVRVSANSSDDSTLSSAELRKSRAHVLKVIPRKAAVASPKNGAESSDKDSSSVIGSGDSSSTSQSSKRVSVRSSSEDSSKSGAESSADDASSVIDSVDSSSTSASSKRVSVSSSSEDETVSYSGDRMDGSPATKTQKKPPPAAPEKTPAPATWTDVQKLVIFSGKPAPHYHRQAIIDLQKKLDPDLKIPLIVTGVKFDKDGNVESITVVKQAETAAIVKQHSKLGWEERRIESGMLQRLATDGNATTKDIPMQGRDLKASWKNMRLAKIAKDNKKTPDQFAAELTQSVRDSVLSTNKTLSAKAATVLEHVSRTLRINDALGTEGIFRLSPSAADVARAVSEVHDNAAIKIKASNPDKALEAVAVAKTLLRERSNKFLSVTDVAGLNSKIDSMQQGKAAEEVTALLQKLPPDELKIWETLINLCYQVQQKQAENKMTAANLAIVVWPGLIKSNSDRDMGPQRLIAHLIENAPHYFKQLEAGPKPSRSKTPAYQAALDMQSPSALSTPTSTAAAVGQKPMKPWLVCLSALSDAADAFDYLPNRFGFTYQNETPPMRQVFQNGTVMESIDVPAGLEKSYQDGKFLEFFGRFVDKVPNGRIAQLNLIDVVMLRAIEDLRQLMKGKMSDLEKVAILDALSQGKVDQARELLQRCLSPEERAHVHGFFSALRKILDVIDKNTEDEEKESLSVLGLASNYYLAIVAVLGETSDSLSEIWGAHHPELVAEEMAKQADATAGGVASRESGRRAKLAATELGSDPDKYFKPSPESRKQK
ncbi:Rho GTPase-activating protein [Lacisediminimonas sp.]|uniref:Rho GTPase-activating protein n=1 Tax=Lacisediminimonas sp. TaxID=3060582 RepID=UPI0027242049|nr:Rho GTPase-activating protein [Lacisediminimonas sp.]MDO8298246.1 Rho GTPase-activating protein [Lacisediminimonas sp.]